MLIQQGVDVFTQWLPVQPTVTGRGCCPWNKIQFMKLWCSCDEPDCMCFPGGLCVWECYQLVQDVVGCG